MGLSICLSVCSSISLLACLSDFLSIHLCVCVCVWMSSYPLISLSVCLSVLLSTCLSVWLPACLSDFLPVYPSVWTFQWERQENWLLYECRPISKKGVLSFVPVPAVLRIIFSYNFAFNKNALIKRKLFSFRLWRIQSKFDFFWKKFF